MTSRDIHDDILAIDRIGACQCAGNFAGCTVNVLDRVRRAAAGLIGCRYHGAADEAADLIGADDYTGPDYAITGAVPHIDELRREIERVGTVGVVLTPRQGNVVGVRIGISRLAHPDRERSVL